MGQKCPEKTCQPKPIELFKSFPISWNNLYRNNYVSLPRTFYFTKKSIANERCANDPRAGFLPRPCFGCNAGILFYAKMMEEKRTRRGVAFRPSPRVRNGEDS